MNKLLLLPKSSCIGLGLYESLQQLITPPTITAFECQLTPYQGFLPERDLNRACCNDTLSMTYGPMSSKTKFKSLGKAQARHLSPQDGPKLFKFSLVPALTLTPRGCDDSSVFMTLYDPVLQPFGNVAPMCFPGLHDGSPRTRKRNQSGSFCSTVKIFLLSGRRHLKLQPVNS